MSDITIPAQPPKELQELIFGIGKLGKFIYLRAKDGVNWEDLEALIEKLRNDEEFFNALIEAFKGINKVGEEIKNINWEQALLLLKSFIDSLEIFKPSVLAEGDEEGKVGVKELEEFLTGLLVLGLFVYNRIKDGADWGDLAALIEKMFFDAEFQEAIIEAFKGADKILVEIKDIDLEEGIYLFTSFVTKIQASL